MRRWTHFIIKIIIIKSCFSKIMIKVASRCSVNIMIDYSFFIIGFSLMVEVSINWTEFFCKLSCQNSLPIQQKSVPCRWFLMIGENVECLSVFIYLFIYSFILLFLLQAVKYPKNSYIFVQDVLGKKINNPLVQQYKQRCVYCEFKCLMKYAR